MAERTLSADQLEQLNACMARARIPWLKDRINQLLESDRVAETYEPVVMLLQFVHARAQASDQLRSMETGNGAQSEQTSILNFRRHVESCIQDLENWDPDFDDPLEEWADGLNFSLMDVLVYQSFADRDAYQPE